MVPEQKKPDAHLDEAADKAAAAAQSLEDRKAAVRNPPSLPRPPCPLKLPSPIVTHGLFTLHARP